MTGRRYITPSSELRGAYTVMSLTNAKTLNGVEIDGDTAAELATWLVANHRLHPTGAPPEIARRLQTERRHRATLTLARGR